MIWFGGSIGLLTATIIIIDKIGKRTTVDLGQRGGEENETSAHVRFEEADKLEKELQTLMSGK